MRWCVGSIGCGRGLFRQYEYEEEIYLKLDGSADVVVNASIPALVALRGADLVDRADRVASTATKVRALYQSPRHEVHARQPPVAPRRPPLRPGAAADAGHPHARARRRLRLVRPIASNRRGGLYVYRQTMGADGAKPVNDAGWNGSEIVAVRMHIPSRIQYHNAPSREVERGNILGWEQPLRDRLAGKPLDVEVRMETESILARTLLIFGISAAAALALLAAVVLWVRRAGRDAAARAR